MIRNLLTLCKSQWDRTAAVVLAAVGLLALLVAWIGVSSTIFTYKQMPYVVSGGLFGVCLVSMAGALWRSADLRDAWRKLAQLEELLQAATSDGRSRTVDLGESNVAVHASLRSSRPVASEV